MGVENVNVYLYESEFHLARGIYVTHGTTTRCRAQGRALTRVADPARPGDHPDPTCKKNPTHEKKPDLAVKKFGSK